MVRLMVMVSILLIFSLAIGCNSSDIFDILDIEIERDFEYYDSNAEETVQAHIKISDRTAEYSDSLGRYGTGTLDDTTATATFSGEGRSGTVTVNFSDSFDQYDGVIEFDDGEVVTFSDSD